VFHVYNSVSGVHHVFDAEGLKLYCFIIHLYYMILAADDSHF